MEASILDMMRHAGSDAVRSLFWPGEYFQGCMGEEEERMRILELTEMVENGEVPPIVNEWTEEWIAYFAEHGEESKKDLTYWNAFDLTYKYLPLGWEMVKLLVSLFGSSILGNKILGSAALHSNVVMVKGLLGLCAWEVDALNRAAWNMIGDREGIFISDMHEKRAQIMTMLLEYGLDPNVNLAEPDPVSDPYEKTIEESLIEVGISLLRPRIMAAQGSSKCFLTQELISTNLSTGFILTGVKQP